MQYSVVIPVLNEQDNILPVAEELCAVLGPGDDHEVIFVDDGSTDATPVRLAAAKAKLPGVQVLRHPAPAGKSAALRTGIRTARGTWIVTMDGDGQNNPADIPVMLAAAQADPAVAMAAGIRRRRDDTTSKRLASRIGNGIRQALLRDDCPDTACGLKVIRRDLFLALPFFATMHRFLPALVRRFGCGVVNVPVDDRARRSGTSKYTNLGRALVGLYDLVGVVWLLRRNAPPPPATEL